MGTTGATGATGAIGVSLWERLQGSCQTIANNQSAYVSKSCSAGKVVLGGGFLRFTDNGCGTESTSTGDVYTLTNGPISDTSWSFGVRNSSGESLFYAISLICADVD
jgi:hypothetical protein